MSVSNFSRLVGRPFSDNFDEYPLLRLALPRRREIGDKSDVAHSEEIMRKKAMALSELEGTEESIVEGMMKSSAKEYKVSGSVNLPRRTLQRAVPLTLSRRASRTTTPTPTTTYLPPRSRPPQEPQATSSPRPSRLQSLPASPTPTTHPGPPTRPPLSCKSSL